MQPATSSNRIKLNRNAFRLESGSVPKRRRTVGKPPALTACGPRASPSPGTEEPVSKSPEDGVCANEGSPDPSRCGGINDVMSESPAQPPPISCNLRFALRFNNATRKPSPVPGTVACYVNGKVCVDSSVCFGPAEPSGEQPSRRGRGRPRIGSFGVQPASETAVKPPWTRASRAKAPDFNKKTKGKKHFGLVTRFHSGRHIKRSVKNLCCALCGDIKYTVPAHKKQAGVRKPRLQSPGLPRRRVGAKVRPAAQAKQKGTLIIGPRVYPKVNLCDIARVFEVTSHDFSCFLPGVLLQKRDHESVHCLKKELRSPKGLYPNDGGKWIGCQISKVCAPTNRCPSLSSGERDSGTTGDQCISDIAVAHDDCPEMSNNLDERMRLTSVEGTPCLPTSCGSVQDHSETVDHCTEEMTAASECRDDMLVPVPRELPLLPQCVQSCSGFGSVQSYQCKSSVDRSPVLGESQADHSFLEENGMSEDSDGELYSFHLFSCQRTQAYPIWPRFSCARTCRSWPFPRRGPPAEMKLAVRTGPCWIATSGASESTEHKVTHNCTAGKNVRGDPVKIELNNVDLLAQKKQGLNVFAKLNKMRTDPAEVQDTGDLKEIVKTTELRSSLEENFTIGKNVICGPVRILESSYKGLVCQKEQEKIPYTNKMERDPIEVQLTPTDSAEYQNKTSLALQSDHSVADDGTIGKNVRYGLAKILGSNNQCLVVHKDQGKTFATKHSEIETDPKMVQQTPIEPAEYQKNSGEVVLFGHSVKNDKTIRKNIRDSSFRNLGSSNECLVSQKEKKQTPSEKLNKSDHSMEDNGTIGKNVSNCLVRTLGSSNVHSLAQREQGQPPSTKLNKMTDLTETDPTKVQETPEEPKEHQKESANSKLSYKVPINSSGTEPALYSPKKKSCFQAIEKSKEAEAGEILSPKTTLDFNNLSDLWSTKPCHSPANKNNIDTISTCAINCFPEVKSIELRSHSDVEPKILPLEKSLDGSKDAAEPTASQGLEHVNQGTQLTSSIMLHSREDLCTSTISSLKMCSTVDPLASPVVALPIEEQGSFASVEMTDPLCLRRTSYPVIFPSHADCKQGKYCSSLSLLSSSSGEDKSINNLSPADVSEDSEVDTECSSLRVEPHGSNRTNTNLPPLCSPQSSMVTSDDMDVLKAYEEDAIILDVIQDDPDLFGVLESTESLMQICSPVALKKGNTVTLQPEKTTAIRNRRRIVWNEPESPRELTAATCKMESSSDFHTVDICEPYQGSMTQFSRSWLPRNPMLKPELAFTDYNNNLDERDIDTDAGNMVNSPASQLVVDTCRNVCSTTGTGTSAPRSLPYCYYYFSEYHECRYVECRYPHSARAEDEKFCMNTVLKFCRAGNPYILQRAVAVFVEYYRDNSPGASFNRSIVNSFLFCLLNLALIRDLLTVIQTLLPHKKTPPTGLMMALYEHVRERGLLAIVPRLILLTSKIVEAGCVFTFDQCEMMQSQLQMLQVPQQQMEIFQAVKCRALATHPQTGEVSVLAQAVVQLEMYKQQENWSELARVFCNVCKGLYSVGELTRFCCSVTIALITESKDKLTLPFETFAEAIFQKEPYDALVKTFLGRVGVSLMFKYYRILDWAKGMKVVLVMSRLHLAFSTLKGLFSSEEGMSRCKIITTATKLFLNSESIEGALNVLRADDWFVSSSTWPCEAGDVENRKRVMTLLAGKTSCRDTLEVLRNLPGLSKPLDGVQVDEYCSAFNTHLRKCVMNQVLAVAADTLEFMLTHGITPDASHRRNVIHKLGKQNIWSRARVLFMRARSAGYYREVMCANDSLALPCCLNEIEMTLAFEMFITSVGATFQNVSDPSKPLLVSLKRTADGKTVNESLYLAAGSRMLSAAQIPNPKLSIRYMAVNQDQEQIFHLDRGSAAKWLSHNHTWAQEMWAS